MSATHLYGKLRSGYSAEPLPLDYESTRVMVNIIDPAIGGIYCKNGRDVLPVGAKIWDIDPDSEDDAHWEVALIPPEPSVPQQQQRPQEESDVPHIQWRSHSFNVSKSQLTRGMITAVVSDPDPQTGIPQTLNCYRALTVVESVEGEGDDPDFEGGVISNGYVGIPYEEQLAVKSGDPPFIWEAPKGLPAGLTLNRNTGLISGTPTQKADVGEYKITVQNAYGMDDGNVTFGIYDMRSLAVELRQPGKKYVVGQPIPYSDLIISYMGHVIQDETTERKGYTLIYNKDKGAGKQTVTVAYDPIAEEVNEPALGYFVAEYVERA